MNEHQEGGARAVLVHLHLRDKYQTADFQEFRELALSAGVHVIESIVCHRTVPDSKYFIGSGKVSELQAFVAENKIEIAFFDQNLTPSQERNLERSLKCRVLDRTGLILDIFAKRARTFEGKLQVELALLKHQSTRLVRGWTHLERQKGGIGLRGGPGETQLEVDRRLIRKRIKNISARLEQVRLQREQGRRARKRASLPTVSLVGYTNAGKSTLFNVLTGASVFVANQLFATLDPTLRAMELGKFGKVVLADTVGFVSKLPHDLVEAFRATLDEVNDADLLVHIIDSHDESWRERAEQVEEVLQEIGALAVPRIEVYNKIDLLKNGKPGIERNAEGLIYRVYLSAKEGSGLELLEEAIIERLGGLIVNTTIRLPVQEGRLRAMLYSLNAIVEEDIDEDVNENVDENEEGYWTLKISLPFSKWQTLLKENPKLESNWKVNTDEH